MYAHLTLRPPVEYSQYVCELVVGPAQVYLDRDSGSSEVLRKWVNSRSLEVFSTAGARWCFQAPEDS
jgi:hypothetical protein